MSTRLSLSSAILFPICTPVSDKIFVKEIEEPVRPVTSVAAYRGALWEEPEELDNHSPAACSTRGSACARGAGTGRREWRNTGPGIGRAARACFLAPDCAIAAYGSGVCGWRPAEPSARHTYRSPRCRTVSTSFAQWLVAAARVCRSPDRCCQSLRDAQSGRESRPGAGKQPGIIARSACWSGPEARALHVMVDRVDQTCNALVFSGILPHDTPYA